MKAIVLSHKDVREHDQIISFYTEECGKREALAKGIKKIVSKNAAHVEPCFLVEVEIIPGREIDHMLTSIPIAIFPEIRSDVKKSLAAQYVVSLVNKMADSGIPDRQIFYLLCEWLAYLTNKKNVHPVLIDLFVFRLFSLLGMQPELDRCVSCGKTEDGQIEQFSLSAGGVICANCMKQRPQDQLTVPCSSAVRQLLVTCLFGTFDGVCDGVEQENMYVDAHNIILKFIRFHTDKHIDDWKKFFV